MNQENNIQVEEKNTQQSRKALLRNIMDGSILTRTEVLKHFPYMMFIFALSMLYIANRHHAENLLHRASKLNTQIKEMKAAAVVYESKLMSKSKQSEVFKTIESKGMQLKIAVKPPHIIKIDE